MNPPARSSQTSWQTVRDTVLARIRSGEWKPGEPIPNEADLARQFSCARVTVNRALRALAEEGLLERRRKAGTRVAAFPTRKARLHIPLIREEIEAGGGSYGYRLLSQGTAPLPAAVARRMGLEEGARLVHLTALHLCAGRPYALEDRWINAAAIPGLADADFSRISANEWLVSNVPFSEGEIALMAELAGAETAAALELARPEALFVLERTTRRGGAAITFVRISYAPGYRLRMTL